jgi:hypothetical protein
MHEACAHHARSLGIGIGIAPHSRHFEKVRLLEAWHAYPCTQPARIMHATCAQPVRSMPKMSTEFFKPCHAMACTQAARSMPALCAQHAGILRAACRQCAENVHVIFQTLSNPIFY